MSDTAENSSDLQQRLDDIRNQKGEFVAIGEIKEVVETVMNSLRGEITSTDVKLYMELESLAEYIESAKSEIAALRPDEVRDEVIPSATDELDAIVEATAEATNRIMDYAELIEGEMEDVPSEVKARVMDATTNIFEACGFQDITGQRITKVVKALQNIEEKIVKLVDAFGTEIDRIKSEQQDTDGSSDKAKEEDGTFTDEELLHGPQLVAEAHSQEEIDALLASFD